MSFFNNSFSKHDQLLQARLNTINFHFKLHGESWCQAGMGHSNCQTTA